MYERTKDAVLFMQGIKIVAKKRAKLSKEQSDTNIVSLPSVSFRIFMCVALFYVTHTPQISSSS